MQGGAGLQLLAATIQASIDKASAVPALAAYAQDLGKALHAVQAATQAAWATGNPQEALANAVPYMQAFGHTVLAWVWLEQALTVQAQDAALSVAANAGRMGALAYFYHYELPKTAAWLRVVSARDMTCAHMPLDAF